MSITVANVDKKQEFFHSDLSVVDKFFCLSSCVRHPQEPCCISSSLYCLILEHLWMRYHPCISVSQIFVKQTRQSDTQLDKKSDKEDDSQAKYNQ